MMSLAFRGVQRGIEPGRPVEFAEARDGLSGIRAARRYDPDVVVADEITSRAGAFALARDLKGGQPPFGGRIVILLERIQDEWLARWSGADAWFTKPVNPFELAETVAGFLNEGQKEAV
jgi:DNA-binding response OmpR family regulator